MAYGAGMSTPATPASPGGEPGGESSGERTSVSVEREIPADAAAIFALLNDPTGHVVLDGSGTVRESAPGNPTALRLGSTFKMGMHMGVPYRMSNTVVEWEQDRRIAWQQGWGKHIWRYVLTPTPAGTLVRETFDWSTARTHFLLKLIKAETRNRVSMEATMDRLEAHFTTSG